MNHFKVILIAPELLQNWFTHGLPRAEVLTGLPEGARFVRAFYQEAPCTVIGMVFEHTEWPDVDPSGPLPQFIPSFLRVTQTAAEREIISSEQIRRGQP